MFGQRGIYGVFGKPGRRRAELPAAVKKHMEMKKRLNLKSELGRAEYVVFDTELTGLRMRSDSIVSIGAVRMRGGRIDIGDVFYRIVRPRTELRGSSVVIHEITPTEAEQSPDIDTLLPEFLEFCGDSILVGHFVAIDLGFLNKEMQRLYGVSLQNAAADTGRIYRWLMRRGAGSCAFQGETIEDLSLRTLAAKYGISVNGSHNALADAFVTAQIFQRLLSELQGQGVKSVRELLRIGRHFKS
ncbi:MAG: PolC-type DNA polymerase III [Acidobacteriota bacterium]